MLPMKFKKLISAVLLSVALVGGGLFHAQSVEAALSKKQAIAVIAKDEQNPTSLQMEQTTTTKYRKKTTTTTEQSVFNSQKGLFHIISTTKTEKKTETTEQWVDLDSKRLYSKQKGQWQYDTLPDFLITELNKLKNSKALKKYNKGIYQEMGKNAKITNNNETYTVKGKVSGKKLLRSTLGMLGQANTKSLLKSFKFSNCKFVYTIKDQKVVSSYVSLKASFAKTIHVRVKQSKSNFGDFNDLQLPDEVKNAPANPLK